MKVKELNIKGFRGFDEAKIKFPSSNVAAFIGINGAGKSSILDCIGIFLADFVDKLTHNAPEFTLSEDDIKVPLISSDSTVSNTIIINTDALAFSEEETIQLTITKSFPTDPVDDENKVLQSYIKELNEQLKVKTSLNLPLAAYYQSNRAIYDVDILNCEKRLKLKPRFKKRQFICYDNLLRKKFTNLSDFLTWFRYEEAMTANDSWP